MKHIQEIFDHFGRFQNPDKRPRWDDQPDRLKELMSEKFTAGSTDYHMATNTIYRVRDDRTWFHYIPMTDRHHRNHGSYSVRNPKVTSGAMSLIKIGKLEDELTTIAERFPKQERSSERKKITDLIYRIWFEISPTHVSKAVLRDIYTVYVDKNEPLPEWMKCASCSIY